MSVACCLMPSEALWACWKAWNTEKWEGPNGQHLRCSSLGWPFYHTNREGIMLITCTGSSKINGAKLSDACSVRANWLCMGWPFCLAEMRREFQTGGNFFCTTLYYKFWQGEGGQKSQKFSWCHLYMAPYREIILDGKNNPSTWILNVPSTKLGSG